MTWLKKVLAFFYSCLTHWTMPNELVNQTKTAVKKTGGHHTPPIVEEMVSILIINTV